MGADHYDQSLVHCPTAKLQTNLNSLSTSKIQYEFWLVCRRLVHELPHCLFHSIHTQPVSTIDNRRSSLRLFDEITEEMGLRVVDHLDASLRRNAAVICL